MALCIAFFKCSPIQSLQTVIVNRLILNLIQGADHREDSDFRTVTGLEPPTFATGSFLGNIGGPLRTLPDDDEVIELEYVHGGGNTAALQAADSVEEVSVGSGSG